MPTLGALQAQSLLKVAEDTVHTRGLVRDQITALAKNNLKSSLDVTFAEVNLQEAELLRSRSQNDLQSSIATLAALIDEPGITQFNLVSNPKRDKMPADVLGVGFRRFSVIGPT